jgi:hypothetical protein
MAQTALIVKAVGEQGGVYLVLTFMSLAAAWAILGGVRYTMTGRQDASEQKFDI